jgi:hypothetical protein
MVGPSPRQSLVAGAISARAQCPNTTACMMRPGALSWHEIFQRLGAERSDNNYVLGPDLDPIAHPNTPFAIAPIDGTTYRWADAKPIAAQA